MRARRRDVHDAPPARFDHVGQRRLDAVKDSVQVDVDDTSPSVEVDVEEALEAVQTGSVHQDDRAQLGTDAVQRCVDGRAVGHVRREGELLVGGVQIERRA